MKVITTDTFIEHLSKLKKDVLTIERAAKAITKLREANSLREIPNIKSMQGYPGFYRLRFGDFRIGFRLVDENTIRLLAIEHRSVFYRDFP